MVVAEIRVRNLIYSRRINGLHQLSTKITRCLPTTDIPHTSGGGYSPQLVEEGVVPVWEEMEKPKQEEKRDYMKSTMN
ncbi:hypothetical protein LXL04_011827 [Taraxacum kok-saghyz]